MNPPIEDLEKTAQELKIRIHDPFAQFLKANATLHTFDLSLLDCYRFAGHACHAITGAFLSTAAAVKVLFPENNTCERGDVSIEFGSELDEKASGPRSNVVSYITGAWGPTGFPGLKGQFSRKNLVSYGHPGLAKNAVRFRRLSNGKSVVVGYNPSETLSKIQHHLDFPESWRVEIASVLNSSDSSITISEE